MNNQFFQLTIKRIVSYIKFDDNRYMLTHVADR